MVDTRELKRIRVEAGYTSRDMGGVIGKSARAYRNRENGVTKFDPDEIPKVVEALKMSGNVAWRIFFAPQFPNGNMS